MLKITDGIIAIQKNNKGRWTLFTKWGWLDFSRLTVAELMVLKFQLSKALFPLDAFTACMEMVSNKTRDAPASWNNPHQVRLEGLRRRIGIEVDETVNITAPHTNKDIKIKVDTYLNSLTMLDASRLENTGKSVVNLYKTIRNII